MDVNFAAAMMHGDRLRQRAEGAESSSEPSARQRAGSRPSARRTGADRSMYRDVSGARETDVRWEAL